MRLLLVSYFFEHEFGGAELVARTTRNLLKDELGWNVPVVCFEDGPSHQSGELLRLPIPLALRFNQQWFKRFVLFLNNPLFDWWIRRKMLRLLRDMSPPETVHCQDLNALLVADALAKVYGVPLILTLHEPVPKRVSPGILPAPLAFVLNAFMRLRDNSVRQALARCHTVMCVSEFVRERVRSCLNSPAGCPLLDLVHPPIEEYLIANAAKSFSVRENNGPARLLFLGRMTTEKGLDLLMDALPLLNSAFEISVLGFDGPIESRVRALADKDPRISLLRSVPHTEVADLIRKHDVVCCPSVVEEACPKTVAEARMLGRRIVTTDRGGIPEIIRGYLRAFVVELDGKTRDQRVTSLAAKLEEAIEAGPPPPFSATEKKVENKFIARFGPDPLLKVFSEVHGRIKRASRRGD